MKKLFLASSFNDVADLLSDFQPNLEGKTVTFIPTASKVEKVVFYVNAGKKALEKLGLTVDILELTTASSEEIDTKLRSNHMIYVTGGNTFFLLQELKRTKADVIIREEVKAGKLYIGESAGAMVTSENIEYVSEMDSVDKATSLNNYDALGIVDFSVVPHYTNIHFGKATKRMIDKYSSTFSLCPITNSQAILVEGDKIKTISKKK